MAMNPTDLEAAIRAKIAARNAGTTTPPAATPPPNPERDAARARAEALRAQYQGGNRPAPTPRTGKRNITARPPRPQGDIMAQIRAALDGHLGGLPAEQQTQLRGIVDPILAQLQTHLGQGQGVGGGLGGGVGAGAFLGPLMAGLRSGGANIQPVPGGTPGTPGPGGDRISEILQRFTAGMGANPGSTNPQAANHFVSGFPFMPRPGMERPVQGPQTQPAGYAAKWLERRQPELE